MSSDVKLYISYILASTQYLPFYGGGKGQYLEVKTDAAGSVLSEKIVPEDSISKENIIKNSDENLLAKVLAANLQSLKTISSNLLKLHNLGRQTGSLGKVEKTRFKSELSALGEAASNTIKLVDEVSEDIDTLFKKNATKYRQDFDGDDVGEEGVAIENPIPTEPEQSYFPDSLVAEAKPYALAVVEHGLASSRPKATAVAKNGVASAQPIATAIAGFDPSLFGIHFQINQKRSLKTNAQ